jgi:hypothetical protein
MPIDRKSAAWRFSGATSYWRQMTARRQKLLHR